MDRLLEQVGRSPKNVRFTDLRKLCDRYFGEPRRNGIHLIYNTPWPGEPRVNIQSSKGMAKPYQVRQVLKAITRLEETV